MKKIYLIVFPIYLFLSNVLGQTIGFTYAKQIGSSGNDVGLSIATDSNGNVYTAGYFNGIVDFDPGVGTFTLASWGLEDGFVTKFDPVGNFIWAKQIGGTGDDRCNSISLDPSGNIFISGQFIGNADFDPHPTNAFVMMSMGGTQEDAFFMKLNSSGTFAWATSIGGNSIDYSYAIKTDLNGDVYSTGSFNGLVDFDPSPATYTLNATSFQTYILKLNTNGNFQWAKTFNTAGSNTGKAIYIDKFTNIYTTGSFNGTTDFDPGPSTSTISTLGTDIYVSKLDMNGSYVWGKSFSGTSTCEGRSIVVDSIGNVYTTGSFGNTVDFDPNGAIYSLTSGGVRNGFISKLNPMGNFVWAKQIGGPSTNNSVYSIILDGGANVYTAGSFNGTVDFDPGSPVYNITSLAGDNDIFIHKLDSSGNFVWAKAFQGTMDDKAYSVVVDHSGSVYSTGSFNGTVDFDPNTTIFTLTNPSVSGLPDVFISKLSCQAQPINVVSSSSVICSGATATLTASGAITYTWNTSAMGSNIVISPTITTNYTVTGSDNSGCTNSIVLTQTVVSCIGIKENNKDLKFVIIYPNPNNGQFNIKIENDVIEAEINIFNAIGVNVYSKKIMEGTNQMDLSDLPKGLYYCKIQQGKFPISTQKIIIR